MVREVKQQGWSRARHGTVAGYAYHLYWQTEVCIYCRMAFREYNAAVKRRSYARKKEARRAA